jgi:FAD/FMN-containing dehydrogenase
MASARIVIVKSRLLAGLRAALGDRHVTTDPERLASVEVDWTRRFRGRALALVRPGTTDEVVATVRACADARIPLVPQGGNTGLVGGGVPHEAVVLSTARLTAVEPATVDGQVTVGAGTTLASVQEHARMAGWAFGVDFAARDSATIGGMVATNAGGVNVLRYGAMRQQVVGLEAVLADGSVISRTSGLLKDNTGYDLAGLLVGSEGTLGVVTRARLRLVPPLPRRAVALLALTDASAAVTLAAELRRRLPSLLAAELFTDAGLRLVLDHARLAPPFATHAPVYLLVECGETEQDPSDSLAAALDAAGFDGDALLEADADARERLWQYRERHTEAINAEGVPHKLDVTLPLDRLAAFLGRVEGVVDAAAPGTRTYLFGHVGDGNVHVNLVGPSSEDEAADDAVLRLVLELGGSISAEHGIGRAKARWLAADRGRPDLAAMRAIKRALDPDGILNPGVLFG